MFLDQVINISIKCSSEGKQGGEGILPKDSLAMEYALPLSPSWLGSAELQGHCKVHLLCQPMVWVRVGRWMIRLVNPGRVNVVSVIRPLFIMTVVEGVVN